mgnify:CR=1 FL=1
MTYLLLHVLQAELQKLFELVDEELEYKPVVREAQAQPLSIIKQLFTGNIAKMTFMLEHWEAKSQGRTYSVHFDGGSQRSGYFICVVIARAAGRCVFD